MDNLTPPSSALSARELFIRMVMYDLTVGGTNMVQALDHKPGVQMLKNMAQFAMSSMDIFDTFERNTHPPVRPANAPDIKYIGLTQRTTRIIHVALSMLPKNLPQDELDIVMDLIRSVEDNLREFEAQEAATKK